MAFCRVLLSLCRRPVRRSAAFFGILSSVAAMDPTSSRERSCSLLGTSGKASVSVASIERQGVVYYKLRVRCESTRRSLETVQRYSVFRSAFRVIRRCDLHGVRLPAFPPKVYARSFFGVALRPKQIDYRSHGLDAYFAAAFDALHELPVATRRKFADALFLEEVEDEGGAPHLGGADIEYDGGEERDAASQLWAPPGASPPPTPGPVV